MEITNKIIKFSSLEGLKAEIEKDLVCRDFLAQRYGVRFIILNNFDTFQQLALFLKKLKVASVSLENLLPEGDDDAWITTDVLKNTILKCEEPSLITPFSELVRFYPEDEFRGFFNEIILSENSYGKRIYVPIIGLHNRFIDFLSHFGRLDESAPIWQCDTETQSVEVFITNKYKDITLPETSIQCKLSTLKDWLRFWKEKAPQDKIICTSLPIKINNTHAKPDSIFKFTPIKNAAEFISKFLDITIPFQYERDDDIYWEALLRCIIKSDIQNFDFGFFVRERFNKISFTAKTAIQEWQIASYSAFDRWLLKQYVINSQEVDACPYFYNCIKECEEYETPNKLFISFACNVFYLTEVDRDKYIAERKDFMLSLPDTFRNIVPLSHQGWIETQIKEIAKSDIKTAIGLCTGTFDFERILLIEWYANQSLDEHYTEMLKELYPDIIAYMDRHIPLSMLSSQLWSIEYFENYKKAKVLDVITNAISEIINNKNANCDTFYSWYYSFKNSCKKLYESNKENAIDKVYWLDGLGVEYLSLIVDIVKRNGGNFEIIDTEITRANIPSSTSLNRFAGDTIVKYPDLDELGHDKYNYQRSVTLAREIDLVKQLINQIILDHAHTLTTIAIVSDHGMSALSRLADSKKYDGKYDHEGRYKEIGLRKADNDEDFIIHTNETDNKRYKVALKHSSLSSKPKHEVHGGCLPEEVLVPFILISNKIQSKVIKYTVRLDSESMPLTAPVFRVTIIPEPISVELRMDDTSYKLVKEGLSWTAKLDNVQIGKQKAIVLPECGMPIDINFEIYGMGFGNINDAFDL